MVLKTVGFLSVMISTTTIIVAIWTFLRSQDKSVDYEVQIQRQGILKETTRHLALRIATICTASIAIVQLLFSAHLLAFKSEDFISKCKSWIIYTLGGVTCSWTFLAVLILLQCQKDDLVFPEKMEDRYYYYENLVNVYYHVLALYSFVHTIEITLLSEFLKFVTKRLSISSQPTILSKV